MRDIFKKLKKALFAAVALACVFAFAGCGSYNPPQSGDDPSHGSDPSQENPENPSPSQPGKPSKPDNPDAQTFTVSLILDDKNGTPVDSELYPAVTKLSAAWTNIDDSKDVVTARFNDKGVATAKLDGDYRVSLLSLPTAYSYNPNVERLVSSDGEKDVTIQLTKLLATSSKPEYTPNKDPNDERLQWEVIPSNKFGVYRATVKSGEEARFYLKGQDFKFSIRTLCDVEANKVKPTITKYSATAGRFNGPIEANIYTVPGESASYTKNQIWTESEKSPYFYFGIKAESKDGGTVSVDFVYSNEGKIGTASNGADPVYSTENFPDVTERPAGEFTLFAELNNKILDDDLVERHDDGYYYLKTGEKLFASLFGDPVPPLDSNLDNTQISINSLNGKNYEYMIRKERKNKSDPYKNHVNADGCYPVNDELKQFLQDFSIGQIYFYDGIGSLEDEKWGYQSDDTSQWLFACGIYVG